MWLLNTPTLSFELLPCSYGLNISGGYVHTFESHHDRFIVIFSAAIDYGLKMAR